MSEIRFEGLNEFSEKLKAIIEKYPKETEEELTKLGKSLRDDTKDRTPVKTGKLKRSYKLSDVKVSVRGTSFVTLKNSSSRFHLVEKGHKIVNKKKQIVGFVPGVHMLENSVTKLNSEMHDELDNWVNKLLEGAK